MKPTPKELYTLLQTITFDIVSWAKPGMLVADVEEKVREMLGEYSSYFTHALGHGVWIQIHESPRVSTKSTAVLEPWMVITIEPGIYWLTIQNTKDKIQNKKFYGLRYEEMVLVDTDKLTVI